MCKRPKCETTNKDEQENCIAQGSLRNRKRNRWVLASIAGVALILTIVFVSIAISHWIKYNRANESLTGGDYQQAITLFEELGDYKDSHDQYLKAKYEKAKEHLKDHNYDDAVNLFKELEEDLDVELDLYIAEFYQCNKEFKSTTGEEKATKYDQLMDLYDGVSHDSAINKTIKSAKKSLYEFGVSQYRDRNFTLAASSFNSITPYQRSKDYLALIDVHDALDDDVYRKKDIKVLKRLFGFEDTKKLLKEDEVFKRFLIGNWRGKGGYYFEMEKDLSASWNIPWRADRDVYQIENLVYKECYDNGKDKGVKNYKFSLVSVNKIKVYSYKTGEWYTLNRQ